MTNFNRSTLPDTVRSNGATPNPWWANAVVCSVETSVELFNSTACIDKLLLTCEEWVAL